MWRVPFLQRQEPEEPKPQKREVIGYVPLNVNGEPVGCPLHRGAQPLVIYHTKRGAEINSPVARYKEVYVDA